jgi:hypothetical protein
MAAVSSQVRQPAKETKYIVVGAYFCQKANRMHQFCKIATIQSTRQAF